MGRPWFDAQRKTERGDPIEKVGRSSATMMPFVKPKTVTEDGQVLDATAGTKT